MVRPHSHCDQLPYAMRFHVGAFAARDDLAAAHDPVVVGDGFGEVVVLLDEQHGQAHFFDELAEGSSYVLDDGRLDVCVIRDIDKFKLFCAFPTIYFGRHLGLAEFEYSQASSARVETKYPFDVYADGEYVCRTPVEISLRRSALRVIVP